ncbi:hypothetical protein JOM56_012782 [Amanita muscaria]
MTCPASATLTPDVGLTEARDVSVVADVRSSESLVPGRRVTRKRKTDAFADLDIPTPAEEIAYKPPSTEELAKAKAAKQKKVVQKPVPKPTGAVTARNLFLIDFRNEHGDNATANDFNTAWKNISEDKLKEYKARANASKAEAKAMTKSALESTSASAAADVT